jgi:hypothetical protein
VDYPLDGCWSKLARAEAHLDALDTDIRAWLKVHEQSAISGHFYPEAKLQAYWWDVPDPPLMWGIQVGDVVHNLRSALDHLVWQLSKTPKSGVGGNQFPILKDEPQQGFDARTKGGMLYGVPGPERTKIEGLQPYIRDPGAKDNNALVLLNDLSNTDKHQLVHFLAFQWNPATPPFRAFGGNGDVGAINFIWVPPDRQLKPGAVLACFGVVDVRGPNPQVEMEGGPTVQIRLENGKNAIRLLSDIALAVQAIINCFIPSFNGGDWSTSAFYDEDRADPGVGIATQRDDPSPSKG